MAFIWGTIVDGSACEAMRKTAVFLTWRTKTLVGETVTIEYSGRPLEQKELKGEFQNMPIYISGWLMNHTFREQTQSLANNHQN